jgi:hypothetical protein
MVCGVTADPPSAPAAGRRSRGETHHFDRFFNLSAAAAILEGVATRGSNSFADSARAASSSSVGSGVDGFAGPLGGGHDTLDQRCGVRTT